jgi:6-phosphogluconate dehydrogenase
MEQQQLSDVGLYGLAVMGQNFALNMAQHGFRVSVCNRTTSKVRAWIPRGSSGCAVVVMDVWCCVRVCGSQIDVTVQRAKDEGDLPLFGFHEVSPRGSRGFHERNCTNCAWIECSRALLLVVVQPADFVASLSKPRKIILLVMAGKPVDDTIEMLTQYLEVRARG